MELKNLVDDKFFLPRLMRLQECLCEELEKAGGPGLCFCGLTPVGRPPLGLMDCSSGECGVAWVSPVSLFPYGTFPAPADGLRSSCATPMAMRVQLGVARCHPRPRRGNATIDAQDSFEAVRLYLSDMAAVKRALQCCFTSTPGKDYIVSLESWEPLEPESNASGGSWTAVIG